MKKIMRLHALLESSLPFGVDEFIGGVQDALAVYWPRFEDLGHWSKDPDHNDLVELSGEDYMYAALADRMNKLFNTEQFWLTVNQYLLERLQVTYPWLESVSINIGNTPPKSAVAHASRQHMEIFMGKEMKYFRSISEAEVFRLAPFDEETETLKPWKDVKRKMNQFILTHLNKETLATFTHELEHIKQFYRTNLDVWSKNKKGDKGEYNKTVDLWKNSTGSEHEYSYHQQSPTEWQAMAAEIAASIITSIVEHHRLLMPNGLVNRDLLKHEYPTFKEFTEDFDIKGRILQKLYDVKSGAWVNYEALTGVKKEAYHRMAKMVTKFLSQFYYDSLDADAEEQLEQHLKGIATRQKKALKTHSNLMPVIRKVAYDKFKDLTQNNWAKDNIDFRTIVGMDFKPGTPREMLEQIIEKSMDEIYSYLIKDRRVTIRGEEYVIDMYKGDVSLGDTDSISLEPEYRSGRKVLDCKVVLNKSIIDEALANETIVNVLDKVKHLGEDDIYFDRPGKIKLRDIFAKHVIAAVKSLSR